MRCLTRALMLCALMLCAALPGPRALAQPGELDGRMARLAILSQKDERLAAFVYRGSTLGTSGCAPMSIANAVIGCFGVEDEAVAVPLAQELSLLLVPPAHKGKVIIDLNYLSTALSKDDRRAQAERYPAAAQVVGGYPGAIRLSEGGIDREGLIRDAAAGRKAVYGGRVYVNDGWTEVISLLRALSEEGRDDIVVYLGYAGAGRSESGSPLRAGSFGHYLSLAFPVGEFWREGTYYVLDSMPRALAEEPAGDGGVYSTRYAFTHGYSMSDRRFRATFDAVRISPTVVRLSLAGEAAQALDAALAAGADEAQAVHERQMRLMLLFGRCLLLVNTAS